MVGETGCPMSALNTAALLETFNSVTVIVVVPIAWYTDAIPMGRVQAATEKKSAQA
jgi:hypothetical protein